MGYTNNGEMFSARNLLELLKSNLRISNVNSRNPESVRAYLYEGSLDSEFIKSKLQDKCMILVPYDADRNHKPCNLNGHKAHWALVMGFLIDNDDNVSILSFLWLMSLPHPIRSSKKPLAKLNWKNTTISKQTHLNSYVAKTRLIEMQHKCCFKNSFPTYFPTIFPSFHNNNNNRIKFSSYILVLCFRTARKI